MFICIVTDSVNNLLGLFGFTPIPGIFRYAVSGQTQTGIVITLRQYRMIQCGLQRASAVGYAALP